MFTPSEDVAEGDVLMLLIICFVRNVVGSFLREATHMASQARLRVELEVVANRILSSCLSESLLVFRNFNGSVFLWMVVVTVVHFCFMTHKLYRTYILY